MRWRRPPWLGSWNGYAAGEGRLAAVIDEVDGDGLTAAGHDRATSAVTRCGPTHSTSQELSPVSGGDRGRRDHGGAVVATDSCCGWRRYVDVVPDESLGRRFKRWFWRPPRAHGETIAGRAVSVLELFYDLVYVAVIGQAAHHLAEHVSIRGFVEFAVVFGLIWVAWVNGSLYLDLHGREDGRTRDVVFIQMGVLTLLAVFTADAADGSGRGFALVYATFLAVMTWLWYSVWRQDRHDHPEYLTVAGRYVAGMVVAVVVVLASGFLPTVPRLVVWASLCVGWVVGIEFAARSVAGINPGLSPTDSLVERLGLFTIIVLGEVIFGVVDGLSSAEHEAKTITTGMIALGIGFGFWWIYFDVEGGRFPKRDGGALANWIVGHYPITLSIAAAGAGMVSLVEHAHDARTPEPTSWLLSGAVTVGLLFVIFTSRAVADADVLAAAFRPLWAAMAGGAVVSLVIGWFAPAPWLLASLLVAVLGLVWAVAVRGFVLAGAWGTEQPAR
jgi:low temperature requirement protein LtrA